MARPEPISEKAFPGLAHMVKMMILAREEAGLSKTEFAQKANVDLAYVSRFEQRKVNPNFTTFEHFAKVLNKPLSYFVE